MKKGILTLLMGLFTFGLQAQSFKEKFHYKVIYKLSYAIDSTNIEDKKSEYMVLYTGNEISAFSSRAKTLSDPFIIRGNSGYTSKAALTEFHYQLIKNNNTNKLYYILKIPKGGKADWFYYENEKDLFNWQIGTETKDIKGYKVQKATTSFAGRNYIAWFSPEIPVSDGPYKFNGLPGLILEISDTDNEWNFEFTALEKLSPAEKFRINLSQYIKTDKEELLDIWHLYRRNPFGYSNNPNVTISPEVEKKYEEIFTEKLRKENNPIELN